VRFFRSLLSILHGYLLQSNIHSIGIFPLRGRFFRATALEKG
jgi:hypothetical protein